MRKFTILSFVFLSAISLFGQIKVFPGGNISLGYTSAAPLGGAKVQLLGNMLFTSTTGSTTSSAYIRGLNAYSTSTNPDYTWRGDSTTGIFHPAGSVLGFSIGGSEKMRVHSNGYVGIGTTSPLEFFQIGDRLTFHNGGTKYIGYNSYYDAGAGQNKRLVADYSTIMAMGGGDINFQVAGTSTAGSAITYNEALIIKNSGDIGINNNAPGYKLDVSGGDINIFSLSNGYRINGNLVLTQKNLTTGLFVGNGAGAATTGTNNHAFGYKALNANTTGTNNLAVGSFALFSNTSGIWNCAIGDSALYSNSTGSSCVAVGAQVLKSSTGGNNTAVGARAMYKNTTGTANSAVGFGALNANTSGANSSAFGYYALLNSTGSSNTALGYKALNSTTTGYGNTAVGVLAAYNGTTGYYNSFLGYSCRVQYDRISEHSYWLPGRDD